jgi:hypothetical protein
VFGITQADQILHASDDSLPSLPTAVLTPVIVDDGISRIQGNRDCIDPLRKQKTAQVFTLQREAIGTDNDLTPRRFEGGNNATSPQPYQRFTSG